MMKLPAKLFLSAVLIYSLSAAHAQTSKITAHYAESTFIKDVYVVSGATSSIPPSYFYSFYGYLYRIDLTLILDGKDFAWDQPVEAEFFLPDGSRRKEIINEKRFPLYPNDFYKFSFEVTSKKKGWVKIELNAPFGLYEADSKFYTILVGLE